MATIKHVLIPIDFSGATRDSLVYAREMAERSQAKLHLLHVVASTGLPLPLWAGAEDQLRDAREQVERLVPSLALDRVPVVREVRTGKPWAEIVGYARE